MNSILLDRDDKGEILPFYIGYTLDLIVENFGLCSYIWVDCIYNNGDYYSLYNGKYGFQSLYVMVILF